MAIEINHLGHHYTYRHPIGWSGGDQHVRDRLNGFIPAGEYPDQEAEEVVARHALSGVLSGGEVISPEWLKHAVHRIVESGAESVSPQPPGARADQILEEAADGRPAANNPERILDDSFVDDDTSIAAGDPDRILEG